MSNFKLAEPLAFYSSTIFFSLPFLFTGYSLILIIYSLFMISV